MTIKTAVLLSGGGRTLQNLLERDLPIEVCLVVASKPGVYGLVRAEERGIPSRVLQRKEFADLGSFSEAVFGACREAGAELVVLAGWLKLLRPIPADYTGKVLNIHPALIPSFCGKGFYGDRVHRAVLAAGVPETGCTVHFVDDEYDHGPVVLQKRVPVRPDDDVHSLADRVFEAECEAYPEAVRLFAEGRLQIDGRQVRLLDQRAP